VAKKSLLDDPKGMREEAESQLARAPKVRPQGQTTSALVHELQVHQIELEMQNEELRRSQVALEDSRDRYAKLYDFAYHFAPVGYCTLSTAGLILELNLTAASFLGQERTSLVGRRLAGFIAPEDGDRWHLLTRTMDLVGERLSIRLAILRKSGPPFHARLDCDCQGGPDGTLVVRVVLTDVSEGVRAEKEIEEYRERVEVLMDESRDGHWTWTEGGSPELSFRASEILGVSVPYPGGGPPGRLDWERRIHREDLPGVGKAVADLLAGRRDRGQIEFRWNRAGTTWRWLLASGRATKRDGAGRALRVVGTVTDVMEQKEAQEALRRSESRGALHSAMVENFPGGIIVLLDRDLQIVLMEGRGEHGLSGAASLAEDLVLETWPPEQGQELEVALRAAMAGRTVELEVPIANHAVAVRAGPVTDSEGRVVMCVATFQVAGGHGLGGPRPGRR